MTAISILGPEDGQVLADVAEDVFDQAVAWVLTERSNVPAQRLYELLGGVEPPEESVMFSFKLDEAESS
jgi:hypothetical protein